MQASGSLNCKNTHNQQATSSNAGNAPAEQTQTAADDAPACNDAIERRSERCNAVQGTGKNTHHELQANEHSEKGDKGKCNATETIAAITPAERTPASGVAQDQDPQPVRALVSSSAALSADMLVKGVLLAGELVSAHLDTCATHCFVSEQMSKRLHKRGHPQWQSKCQRLLRCWTQLRCDSALSSSSSTRLLHSHFLLFLQLRHDSAIRRVTGRALTPRGKAHNISSSFSY